MVAFGWGGEALGLFNIYIFNFMLNPPGVGGLSRQAPKAPFGLPLPLVPPTCKPHVGPTPAHNTTTIRGCAINCGPHVGPTPRHNPTMAPHCSCRRPCHTCKWCSKPRVAKCSSWWPTRSTWAAAPFNGPWCPYIYNGTTRGAPQGTRAFIVEKNPHRM